MSNGSRFDADYTRVFGQPDSTGRESTARLNLIKPQPELVVAAVSAPPIGRTAGRPHRPLRRIARIAKTTGIEERLFCCDTDDPKNA
jgi:hypothetical protein